MSPHRVLWTPLASEAAPSTPQGAPAPGARRGLLPARVQPMLAETGTPFSHPDWWFEIKWDGWRALTFVDGDEVRFLSRRGRSLADDFPVLGDVRRRVRASRFVLDGEVVALDERGLPDFHRLQRRDPRGLTYYVFDLLHLDGFDLTSVSLEERRGLLASVLDADAVVRLSDHVVEAGEQLFAMIEARGLEGVMAKHRRSPYVAGRHPAWLKIKCTQTADCVVVGLTQGERAGFGALVLAMFDDGRLVHVGNVGSGFNDRSLASTLQALQGLHRDRCPLAVPPVIGDPVTWLEPRRVCEVKFAEWTADAHLRFPVFLRLRDDKSPRECTRGLLDRDPSPPPGHADGALLPASRPRDLSVIVDGVRLQLTNLDKVYFPADGITKGELIDYYHAVSGLLLPHLRQRILTLKRYPDGITRPHFFQRHGESFPAWVERAATVDDRGQAVDGVVCNDLPTLVFLTNLGCIDQNPQQSRVGSPDSPDWLLLDLDPQGCSYDKVVEVALLLADLLGRVGLRGWPKTTGGRGLHIYVPLAPGATFEQSAMLAQLLARVAAASRPDLITLARLVQKRAPDRVYIDYPQGGRGRSISAPYVVRPRPGATVATPLAWEEVRPGLHPDQFTLRTVLPRFRARGDLFAPVLQGGQDLHAAIARIDSLVD